MSRGGERITGAACASTQRHAAARTGQDSCVRTERRSEQLIAHASQSRQRWTKEPLMRCEPLSEVARGLMMREDEGQTVAASAGIERCPGHRDTLRADPLCLMGSEVGAAAGVCQRRGSAPQSPPRPDGRARHVCSRSTQTHDSAARHGMATGQSRRESAT
ncbi:hypothetical protein FA09DRAFT_108188 [Tilletiopsis washingtonensis]|uniref:Uncharacterized protein n=1 Tax=Tilletiopsis washingtonensis TaxID=58919 RepID=A0A316ZHB1_9BASI|nr:hypothetical protein FA09DRAFT_108188 [Tilletiopsis washingtonensis]PWO00647.1 hypothetical protein FA09DRAFT_108188 [Tilletiopsis washingtonensis]